MSQAFLELPPAGGWLVLIMLIQVGGMCVQDWLWLRTARGLAGDRSGATIGILGRRRLIEIPGGPGTPPDRAREIVPLDRKRRRSAAGRTHPRVPAAEVTTDQPL